MGFYQGTRSYWVVLILISFLHVVLINLDFINPKKRGGRGGTIQRVYLKHTPSSGGGKGDSSAKKKVAQIKESSRKAMRPKPRSVPEKTLKKSEKRPEEIKMAGPPVATHNFDEVIGFEDEAGRGTVGDGYGPGSGGVGADRIKEAYLNSLRIEIERHKEYPRRARMFGHKGTVGVYFIILKDGTITGIELRKRCRYADLNASALELFSRIKRFDPIPRELKMDRMELTVYIEYILL